MLNLDDLPLPQRQQAIAQAMANLRARGVRLSPLLVALYHAYGAGTRTRAQVHAAVLQHTGALLSPNPPPLTGPTLGDTTPCFTSRRPSRTSRREKGHAAGTP